MKILSLFWWRWCEGWHRRRRRWKRGWVFKKDFFFISEEFNLGSCNSLISLISFLGGMICNCFIIIKRVLSFFNDCNRAMCVELKWHGFYHLKDFFKSSKMMTKKPDLSLWWWRFSEGKMSEIVVFFISEGNSALGSSAHQYIEVLCCCCFTLFVIKFRAGCGVRRIWRLNTPCWGMHLVVYRPSSLFNNFLFSDCVLGSAFLFLPLVCLLFLGSWEAVRQCPSSSLPSLGLKMSYFLLANLQPHMLFSLSFWSLSLGEEDVWIVECWGRTLCALEVSLLVLSLWSLVTIEFCLLELL